MNISLVRLVGRAKALLFDGGGTALTSTLIGSDQALDVNVVQTTNVGALVTLTETQVSIPDATSTELLASNSGRAVGSFVQNNTRQDVWLSHTGTAVATQGVRLARGGVYSFNTAQSVHAFQSSGGAINLDVVEAT